MIDCDGAEDSAARNSPNVAHSPSAAAMFALRPRCGNALVAGCVLTHRMLCVVHTGAAHMPQCACAASEILAAALFRLSDINVCVAAPACRMQLQMLLLTQSGAVQGSESHTRRACNRCACIPLSLHTARLRTERNSLLETLELTALERQSSSTSRHVEPFCAQMLQAACVT